MCGIKAEDVDGGGKNDGGDDNVRPVGGDGGVEIRAKADEDARDGAEEKEDGVQREMAGNMPPVFPKGAVGVHKIAAVKKRSGFPEAEPLESGSDKGDRQGGSLSKDYISHKEPPVQLLIINSL